MTEIRPFRGWHYTGEVSKLIAPPYDILSAADKQALLDKSADNIVSVDMPHVPPKEVGPDHEYQAAAEKLRAMQAAGTLVQDGKPALYAYSQTYTWAGRTYTRRAMLCAVRATELCEGVWPHEKTFAGPKADRLKLTEITHMQLSPIFGFFEDDGAATAALWNAAKGKPAASGELSGVKEEMWVVTDEKAIAQVAGALANKPIFIADGHHRYTTALNYRNALHQAGKIDDQHPANFVLFALVAMDDPGLLVLPTHRLITGLKPGFGCRELIAAMQGQVDWQQAPADEKLFEDADGFLKAYGPHAMAFLDPKCQYPCIARLKDSSVMTRLAPAETDTWRSLDVAVLHKLFIDEHLSKAAAGELSISYTAHGREVREALEGSKCQMAVMLQGTPLPAVKDIALAHAVMPHKSTYFYPKLATGMVLKPLE